MVTQNGDVEVLSIKIVNDFSIVNTLLSIPVNLPAGLGYHSHSFVTEANAPIASPSRAIYNGTTNLGSIANMLPGEVIILKLGVYVTDVLSAIANQFTVTGSVVSTLTEANLVDNSFTKLIAVTTCAPASGPVSFTGCCCGNIIDKITPCSHGTTKIKLVSGSLVNIASLLLDESTGEYTAVLTTPIANGSFQYEVWCTVGVDEYLTGTGTVTVSRLFVSFPTGEGVEDESYYFGEIIPGTTGNVVNLASVFPVACVSGSPVYSVAYDSDVYENVNIVGSTLTYDVKLSAPVGSYPLIIQRDCV